MKNNRLHFRPAGFYLTALIFGSSVLFTGCEPETEELQQAEMQTNMEMETKQSMKDMPKKNWQP